MSEQPKGEAPRLCKCGLEATASLHQPWAVMHDHAHRFEPAEQAKAQARYRSGPCVCGDALAPYECPLHREDEDKPMPPDMFEVPGVRLRELRAAEARLAKLEKAAREVVAECNQQAPCNRCDSVAALEAALAGAEPAGLKP